MPDQLCHTNAHQTLQQVSRVKFYAVNAISSAASSLRQYMSACTTLSVLFKIYMCIKNMNVISFSKHPLLYFLWFLHNVHLLQPEGQSTDSKGQFFSHKCFFIIHNKRSEWNTAVQGLQHQLKYPPIKLVWHSLKTKLTVWSYINRNKRLKW